MRRLVPAVLLLSATLTLADGGRLDPAIGPRPPAVGERRRVRLDERLTQRQERVMDGAPARALETDERTEAVWLQQVLEVADGRVAAARVTIERWRRQDGGAADVSLEGRVAVVRPLQASDRVRLEPAQPEVSGAATAFLERVADRLAGAPVDLALTPAREVAVGEGWDARERVAALVAGAPFTEVDLRRSEALATLRAVEGELRTVTLDARLQLVTVPGSSDRFADGGEYHLTLRGRWRAGERPSQGSIEERAEVTGAARGQLPEGTPYRTTVSLKLETTTSEEAIP